LDMGDTNRASFILANKSGGPLTYTAAISEKLKIAELTAGSQRKADQQATALH
jgi:hypothetical protein